MIKEEPSGNPEGSFSLNMILTVLLKTTESHNSIMEMSTNGISEEPSSYLYLMSQGSIIAFMAPLADSHVDSPLPPTPLISTLSPLLSPTPSTSFSK